MRNKKVQIWFPLILSLGVIAGMFIGYRIKGNMPDNGIFFLQKQKPVQEVLDLIDKKYVDNENVDSLGGLAIQSILSSLDPHSIYMPARQLKETMEDLQGLFYGIGVEFNILNDTTNIINVLAGGPSEKAGLKLGDKIIYVGDSLIAGNHTSSETLKNLLRGAGDSKVSITVLRGKEQKKMNITRGAIPLFSLDAAYMITDTIGYIRLNKFSENTYKEFMGSMEKLQAKGMKALIFDLRDNGGGILTEATHIADEFLSGNKLITYTEGVHSPKKEYRCDKEGVFETGKLIILANEGTASASEILIGALQDYERATIIGRRTFGKGLVQEQYELSDGSGLRLTVARYYTPLGRSIQKSYASGAEDYSNDILNRYKHGEMSNEDSIKHTNEKQVVTSSGKVLYGGGGITPDLFVPVDTNGFDKPMMKALISGTINQFVYVNYLHNQHEFSSFTSPKIFKDKYVVNDTILKNFKDYAEKDSIFLNFSNSSQKMEAERQIKTLTARQIWQTEGFYEISNSYDAIVNKALSYISGNTEKIAKK
ncbi:MAG: S41 family peptidase [Ginsengibacter sp.]